MQIQINQLETFRDTGPEAESTWSAGDSGPMAPSGGNLEISTKPLEDSDVVEDFLLNQS